MGSQVVQPAEPGTQAATSAVVPSTPPSPAVAAGSTRSQRPPHSAELPDYQAYTYGYPPVSGRMFGSGN
jgi:hypothetical protein